MFNCLQIMRANVMSLEICFKKLHLVKVGAFALLDVASKFALFLVSSLKDEKLIKKQSIRLSESYE